MKQEGMKPKWPSCESRQYDHDAGNDYLEVSYDENWNERAEDKSQHANATPQQGEIGYSQRHYNNDFSTYGREVSAPSGSSTTATSGDRADRGKES